MDKNLSKSNGIGNKPKKVELIKSMSRDTALRYVEARKEIDNKLCQIMSQGGMLQVLAEVNHIELCHVSNVGDLIEKIANDIYGMLDDFISSSSVELELKGM